MINFQQLQLLVAVAEMNSVTKAGERVGYSPTGSVTALQRLEEEVGARLVDRERGRGRSTLTQAGETFLPYATRILSTYHRGLLRLFQDDQEQVPQLGGALIRIDGGTGDWNTTEAN